MEKFIIALIFLSCVLIPSDTITQASVKEVGGLLVMSSFIIWWLWKYNKWLSAFVAWLVLRSFMPPTQPRMMLTLINVFMGCSVYLAIRNMDIDYRKIYRAIFATVCVQSFAVIAQKLNVFMFWNGVQDYGRVWGLFGNSNWSSSYIAMTLPVSLHLSKENKWYLLGLSGIPAVIIMGSKIGIIATISGVFFWVYMRYRGFIVKHNIHTVILACLIAVTTVVCYKPLYFDDGGRLEMWYRMGKFTTWQSKSYRNVGDGWGEGSCHFIQGRGLGSAYTILPRIMPRQESGANEYWLQAHNEYLQVLLEYGFIGLILCLGLIVSTFRKYSLANLCLLSCGVGLLVSSVGFFPFRISPMGYMGIIYLGLIDKNA